MSDPWVLKSQQFLNAQYNNGQTLGISKVTEDGKTGWETMYALIRGLQHELGITALPSSFGPTTLETLSRKYPAIGIETPISDAFCKIIQSALYCTGYDGGSLDGVFGQKTLDSISVLKSDIGVRDLLPSNAIEPKVMKALFNLDAYVLLPGGRSNVRGVQRWLNSRYANRRDFFIIPCDGLHSRKVASSMLFAIQYELGLADGVANGVFGPTTRDKLKAQVVIVGANDVWAYLFTAALILQGKDVLHGNFDETIKNVVTDFQQFSGLPISGKGDFATWASLLVSYGDQTRKGSACDGVTKITATRAATLKQAGYQTIGRYLFAATDKLPEKQIQPGELLTISSSGLSCFPIFQTWGRSADYFGVPQGSNDAYKAIDWAKFHGFKRGTIIYFAADYDALPNDIDANILPHFRAINAVFNESTSGYQAGAYGARSVCRRVAEECLSVTSFVSDMSSGFSGNLGEPLPNNWAFDQISTIKVGSGDSLIEIDNNIASGRDLGQNTFDVPDYPSGLDVDFRSEHKDAFLADVQAYLTSIGIPETGGDGWTDGDWATLGGISTTKAVESVLGIDWLMTSLARDFRIRKSLIQAPVIWELRKYNFLDFYKDEAVKAGTAKDSSTGWAQIFAIRAIIARNYCVEAGEISGELIDPEAGLRDTWFKLHNDVIYNVKSAACHLIWNSHDLKIARPGLTTSLGDTQKILRRYNGSGPEAELWGQQVMGLYNIIENYNALIRSN